MKRNVKGSEKEIFVRNLRKDERFREKAKCGVQDV